MGCQSVRHSHIMGNSVLSLSRENVTPMTGMFFSCHM